MIRVQSHPRGLAVFADQITNFNSLIRQFEKRIDANQFLIHSGRIIIPLSLAAEVSEILTGQETSWDEGIFQKASSQLKHREMQLSARMEVTQALEDPYTALNSYPLLSNLDSHQVAAVAAITVSSLRGLALFDEQGTGKTIVALAAFDFLRSQNKIKHLLVVAPKSVLGAWQSDCETFLHNKYRVATVSGSSSERSKAVQSRHDILLVSYDSMVNGKGLIKMVVAANPMDYMLVIDESYYVKNPKTVRSQAIASIRPFCERAIVLCGTPAPNSAIDVVNQIDLADGGVSFAGRVISKDPHEALEQVGEALEQTIYLRRLKEDVLPDLPVKQFERVLVELCPIQQTLYNQAKNELLFSVKSVDDYEFTRNLTSFLARRAVLLQICSNPSAINPLYSEVPTKLLALDKMFCELIEGQNKKVVVWSYFRSSLQAIAERYRHYGLVRIDGSVLRVEDRLNAIRSFQGDDTIKIFLGNAAAAGAGITLTASHHAIYESFSNQAAHYMQSVDRIHRRGQTQEVVNHILLARNTIEMSEFNKIRQKERNGKDLLGDRHEEPITRDRFLADLEALDD